MGRRRFTEADDDRIAAMHESGLSGKQIAEHFQCSEFTIASRCLRMGIGGKTQRAARKPVMNRGSHIVRTFTPQEDSRLLELEAEGLGYSEIGRALNRTHSSIYNRLRTLARQDALAEDNARELGL